jgi:hypothetical protein
MVPEVHTDVLGAVIYLVLAALLWFVLVRVVWAYRRQGGRLPIDVQRLLNLRRWWNMSDWPQTVASITETRICFPEKRITRIANPTGLGFPPNTIQVSFQYEASGSRHDGKFSVAFMDMDWATMATRNAVGQKVKVRFNPKDPEECVPVENEWSGFKLWSVG